MWRRKRPQHLRCGHESQHAQSAVGSGLLCVDRHSDDAGARGAGALPCRRRARGTESDAGRWALATVDLASRNATYLIETMLFAEIFSVAGIGYALTTWDNLLARIHGAGAA